MLLRHVIGCLLLVASFGLVVWGYWSHWALGRGWPTITAFAVSMVCLAILGTLIATGAIEPADESAGEDDS